MTPQNLKSSEASKIGATSVAKLKKIMIFTKGKGKLEKATVEEIQSAANDNKYEITGKPSKVNDGIYRISKYKVNKHAYIFNQKKLTTISFRYSLYC